MVAYPAKEVVPFHVIWLGFALAYGFEAWPLGRTVVALVAVTAGATVVLVTRAADGAVDWLELSELPLMALVAVLVVWHVRRREALVTEVRALAARELRAAVQRARMHRLTSHEMRTPLTIASGYLDMVLDKELDSVSHADLLVVQDELGRLTRAADRMLRMIRLQDSEVPESVDLDELVRETAERWSAVARRHWSVEAAGGVVVGSAERIRVGLDTLIENALRYTTEQDTVRLVGLRSGSTVLLGVADSGPGLAAEKAVRVNSGVPRRASDRGEPDPRSLTGLGLSIVDDVAEQHGGRVVAGRSREGGALVALLLDS